MATSEFRKKEADNKKTKKERGIATSLLHIHPEAGGEIAASMLLILPKEMGERPPIPRLRT